MNRWLFSIFAVWTCSIQSLEKIESLSAKVILQDTNGYFVLSDGSCWKAVPFSKRWRSLNEWWNGVELVPKNYESLPADWYLGSQIEVYAKNNYLKVNEANAANQDVLKQCTHLLLNTRTEEVLFAISLHPAECLTKLFEEAKKEGYSEGYSKGRLSSYQDATEAYNGGYYDGYQAGYAEGVRVGVGEHN